VAHLIHASPSSTDADKLEAQSIQASGLPGLAEPRAWRRRKEGGKGKGKKNRFLIDQKIKCKFKKNYI